MIRTDGLGVCYASILFGITMSAVVLLDMGVTGAGNKKRLSDIFKFSSVMAIVLGSVLTAVMVVLRTPLVIAIAVMGIVYASSGGFPAVNLIFA